MNGASWLGIYENFVAVFNGFGLLYDKLLKARSRTLWSYRVTFPKRSYNRLQG
jgi:hypothetical protein